MYSKFYTISNGWATRYFWFDIMEEFPAGQGLFEERIKRGELTFKKRTGTTPADIHGSTMAIEFYSQKFIDILKKNKITFKSFKLKFVPEMSKIGNYYYLEFKELPSKKIIKNGLVDEVKFYLKDWHNDKIFTLQDTRITIVTEEFKKDIERAKLKNVEFKMINPI